ncbi:uncharacterized protein A4U43_C10F15240, partial [Asparagus officinalis]
CLDGSPPGYHLHRGFGSGAQNWILQMEGGAWCNDELSCYLRSKTAYGSSLYMGSWNFSGILSNDPNMNPDFYNWNRVFLRYCDGASFAGNSEYRNGTKRLYFRGLRIWDAIVHDLFPEGLQHAEKALLSGCSAGGLATFLHCDNFSQLFPETTIVKCMSDAGFFLDVKDKSGYNNIRHFFRSLVKFQGVEQSLSEKCVNSHHDPYLCFFPQHALKHIRIPYFVLNSAYDVTQVDNIFVPLSSDPCGHWKNCKLNYTMCTPNEINILQGYRSQMLKALRSTKFLENGGGMFINSCFSHCQSEEQYSWFAPLSPKVHNKTIAVAVGDWYFGREVSVEVDCPYPCNPTCLKPNSLIQIVDLQGRAQNLNVTEKNPHKKNSCSH